VDSCLARAARIVPNEHVIRILTILVVDECPATRQFVDLVVGADHVRVVGACDGYAALDCVRRFRPDLVLAARGLSGLAGTELAARLVRHGTPVVLMRGSLDPVPPDPGTAAHESITKPLQVGDLRAVVSRFSSERPSTTATAVPVAVPAQSAGDERPETDPINDWLGAADATFGSAPRRWRSLAAEGGALHSFAHDVAALRDGRVTMTPLRFSTRRHTDN
jgi:CheY-like chemotaxis protein